MASVPCSKQCAKNDEWTCGVFNQHQLNVKNMDEDTETPPITDPVPMKAAYITAGPAVEDEPGLHCSMFPNEFCFFCSYERNSDANGSDGDLYSSLVSMVEHLAGLRREPSAIVCHVYDAYEETVRQHVPDTPQWHRPSILRHLLYSGQFEAITDGTVGQMLTSLIARQNRSLIDVNTDLVIEENLKSFRDTVLTLIKWKASNRANMKSVGKGKF